MPNKKAVYVGRLNPIHFGHINVINEMISEYGVDNSLLVLGSSTAPMSIRNFFSYEERKSFVKKLYPELKVVGLPDFHNDELWLKALDDLLKLAEIKSEEAVFYGGCDEDVNYFIKAGKSVRIYDRFNKNGLVMSATEVREALMNGNSINGLVHDDVISDIEEIFKKKWEQFKKI